MTKQEMLDLMDSYAIKEYTYNIPAKPYVAETLRALSRAGHSLNVLTASPHKMLDVCLKRLNLFDLFDNVWSYDDFGTTKANPDKFTVPHYAHPGLAIEAFENNLLVMCEKPAGV